MIKLGLNLAIGLGEKWMLANLSGVVLQVPFHINLSEIMYSEGHKICYKRGKVGFIFNQLKFRKYIIDCRNINDFKRLNKYKILDYGRKDSTNDKE